MVFRGEREQRGERYGTERAITEVVALFVCVQCMPRPHASSKSRAASQLPPARDNFHAMEEIAKVRAPGMISKMRTGKDFGGWSARWQGSCVGPGVPFLNRSERELRGERYGQANGRSSIAAVSSFMGHTPTIRIDLHEISASDFRH
jgi:hypothetical protein